jgi:isopentenyl diphosphate isomerase/L-lactate dehydrogenase-like FMN-dependent dehydrogenase
MAAEARRPAKAPNQPRAAHTVGGPGMPIDQAASRRNFLKFLAASSVLTYADARALAETLLPKSKLPDPMIWAPLDANNLIKTPKDAINVFDFEPVMRQNVPPAHFGYMASGIDDEVTLRANREAFLKFQLRPRRLIDVSKIDMSVDILGTRYASPIMVAPTGGHKAYHADGEEGVARAAKAGDHLMILSTQTSTGVEDVIKTRGAPIWMQLYATNKFEVAAHHIKRAEKAGCTGLAVTVDRSGGRNQETLFRLTRTDNRECKSCHDRSSLAADQGDKPMYEGVDLTGLRNIQSSAMSWDYLKRLRDLTKMKVVIKGLLAWEDAKLAADYGYDAIIVSNHGARSEDSGRATIDALPEIVEAVNGRMPILIDSGFRRGTDVCKALCMGATAVAVGRPYLWGLGAFGQPGVERALEILRTELFAIMQQVGATSVKALTPAMVRRA